MTGGDAGAGVEVGEGDGRGGGAAEVVVTGGLAVKGGVMGVPPAVGEGGAVGRTGVEVTGVVVAATPGRGVEAGGALEAGTGLGVGAEVVGVAAASPGVPVADEGRAAAKRGRLPPATAAARWSRAGERFSETDFLVPRTPISLLRRGNREAASVEAAFATLATSGVGAFSGAAGRIGKGLTPATIPSCETW